jgi:imidazoleglycerol-phosphate dehydratase/histidinol-phosphatase
MSTQKVLFIDRDGTLIVEPADQQIDSLEKLELIEGVMPALLRLRDAGYRFVIVSNQDGLGTAGYPRETYEVPQAKMMRLFSSQGITFDDVLICPHFPADGCTCRKPHLGLVRGWLTSGKVDFARSAVIGDRATDLELARNMGVQGFRLATDGVQGTREGLSWAGIAQALLAQPRAARVTRKTRETDIEVSVNLDGEGRSKIATGIGFFDHMLEQIAKHGGMDLDVRVAGDLHIDEHHTIEDTALALGEAIRRAAGDKFGIERYSFVLPMDEARANVSLDFSGRAYFVFEGQFPRLGVGGMPSELVPHFFKSLSDAAGLTLHMSIQGENAHHMIEALFKATARALRLALRPSGTASLPSTKGTL